MGWRDELRKSLSTAARIGLEVAAAGRETVNAWAAAREAERRFHDFDDRMEKAARAAAQSGKDTLEPDADGAPVRDPKAIHFDPFDIVAAMGYRERPTSLTFAAMEMMGRGVPVIADVINTRIKQVSMFCELPEDRHSPGFRVRNRDWRTKPLTKAGKKEAERLEQLLLHTGYFDPEKPWESVPLRTFASQFIGDSLIFDQAVFEIVPDRLGRPSYITIVDAASVRLLDPGSRDKGDPFAVQVVNNSIVESFTRDELAFCIRNPRSGIRSFGYGTSEIETLVKEITGLLWGMDYNRKFFQQGSATKGILNFKGMMPDKQLTAFRRQWYAMVSGVTNAWRTPITNADELQWINLQMSNRDMEYSAWMDFLIKIICARYNIATEEVNFSYGNTGQSQAMGTAPIEEKLKASRDLGLRPLVRWFFVCLNQHFIQRINPDFEVVPYGLDEKGAEAETDLLAKQLKSFMTVNEARERMELPALPDEQGEVILDPTWLQFVQAKEAMAQGDMDGMGDEMGDEMGADDGGMGDVDPESGFGVSDEDDAPPFGVADDDAVKSMTTDRVRVYEVDL